MAQDKLLELHDVTSGYGDIRVLWSIELDVAAGGLTAVLGRNGAGKTTLLRTIAGLNKVRKGSIRLLGQDITSAPPYDRAGRGIGYVQEGKRVFRMRTVEENLRLGTHSLKLRRRDQAALIEEQYERFPILGERRHMVAGSLSGGQQQMLAIGQALAGRPALLLLDEPSAGLAPAIVAEVFGTIQRLSAEGLTILLVEQAIDYALQVATEAYVLDLGRVVLRGDPSAEGFRGQVEDKYFARVPDPL
jgi:branched-chain amino acid transport system ATP-binding protein